MQAHDETWLVLRAQSGDSAAFEALLRRVQEPLYRCVRNLTCEDELARDVLQDVFVILYRNLIWLREASVFRAWAYRIATREALKRLRRERRRQMVHDEEVLESIVDTHVPDIERQHLARALPGLVARLAPRSRAVVVLHYLEDLTLSEVADVLEISLGTVKSRLAYGLQALRKQF